MVSWDKVVRLIITTCGKFVLQFFVDIYVVNKVTLGDKRGGQV